MSSKSLGLNKKLWWIIFLILYLGIIALMVASIFTDSWVYTNMKVNIKNYETSDSDLNNFKGKDFSGSLFHCIKSCDARYSKLSEEWCDSYEKVVEAYMNEDNDKYIRVTFEYLSSVSSLCATFRNLEKSMKIYAASEAFAVLCMIAIVILIILFFFKIKVYYLVMIFTVLGCVAHLEGFITYAVLTKTNFMGWCDDFPLVFDLPIELCAGHGPNLALAISVILPLTSILFCIFRQSKSIGKLLINP